MDTLLKPENKKKLAGILTYHVVAGDVTAEKLEKMIKKDGGKASLTTVNGEKLVAKMDGDKVTLTDKKRRCGHGHPGRREAVQRRDPRHRQSVAPLIRFS